MDIFFFAALYINIERSKMLLNVYYDTTKIYLRAPDLQYSSLALSFDFCQSTFNVYKEDYHGC